MPPPKLTAEEHVRQLYRLLLFREADADGLASGIRWIEAGRPIDALIETLMDTDEYRRKHSTPKPPYDFKALQADQLVIVDLGAQSLGFEDHAYQPLIDAGLDWRCIGFEPQGDKAEERVAAEGDERLDMRPHFIGDGGAHTFHLLSDSGSSSLLPFDHAFSASFHHLSEMETLSTEPVTTVRLDDVLEEERVDFLKLDIQGFELEALKGAVKTLAHTNAIHCEVHFAQTYKGSPLFVEIERFLAKLGFDFIDFVHLARYRYVDVPEPTAGEDRLLWGEALFLRKLDPTRDTRHDVWSQAAIVSLVYGKHGLAQKLWDGASENFPESAPKHPQMPVDKSEN